MTHIFIDLEMNTIEKENRQPDQAVKHEIVEIGAVKLDNDFNIIDEYISYVKPQINGIAENCTMITGITNEMVSSAPPFNVAILDFISWIGDDDCFTIYSWSNTDKRQLLGECELKNVFDDEIPNPFVNWIDFQKVYSKILGIEQVLSLGNAMSSAGLELVGNRHSALADAQNATALLSLVKTSPILHKAIKPRKKKPNR